MKTLLFALLLAFLFQFEAFSQDKFNLEPSQSMLMTGKGPGQDATINPFEGEDCYAVIKNKGKRSFSIRIQKQGTILQTLLIKKGEVKKLKLLAGQELYLDSNAEGTAKAVVDYEQIEPK